MSNLNFLTLKRSNNDENLNHRENIIQSFVEHTFLLDEEFQLIKTHIVHHVAPVDLI